MLARNAAENYPLTTAWATAAGGYAASQYFDYDTPPSPIGSKADFYPSLTFDYAIPLAGLVGESLGEGGNSTTQSPSNLPSYSGGGQNLVQNATSPGATTCSSQ